MSHTDSLTEEELVRYHRQILLPSFGEEGQKRLKGARVMIAGVGGLGSPVALYLCCAGVGHIILVDSDLVELSNLNRQILLWEEDIGKEKVFSAAEKLKRLNSTVEIVPIHMRITAENVAELVKPMNLVIDCLDNMETRFILNEGCVREGIPFIHGGIYGFRGEVTTIIPGRTPCFECIFPRDVKGKSFFPVFGAIPALIASLQVIEAIKLLSGCGELLEGKMLYVSGEEMGFTTFEHRKNENCRICGNVRRFGIHDSRSEERKRDG